MSPKIFIKDDKVSIVGQALAIFILCKSIVTLICKFLLLYLAVTASIGSEK